MKLLPKIVLILCIYFVGFAGSIKAQCESEFVLDNSLVMNALSYEFIDTNNWIIDTTNALIRLDSTGFDERPTNMYGLVSYSFKASNASGQFRLLCLLDNPTDTFKVWIRIERATVQAIKDDNTTDITDANDMDQWFEAFAPPSTGNTWSLQYAIDESTVSDSILLQFPDTTEYLLEIIGNTSDSSFLSQILLSDNTFDLTALNAGTPLMESEKALKELPEFNILINNDAPSLQGYCPSESVTLKPDPSFDNTHQFSWMQDGMEVGTLDSLELGTLVGLDGETLNYSLLISKDGACREAMVSVIVKDPGSFDLGEKVDACGDTIFFDFLSRVNSQYASGNWTANAEGSVTAFPDDNLNTSFTTNSGLGTFGMIWTVNVMGCSVSDEVLVEFLEDAKANLGEDRFICPGESVVLGENSSSNGTYTWFPSEGLDDTTARVVTASPVVSRNYIQTVDLGQDCIASDTIRVNVLETISISSITNLNDLEEEFSCGDVITIDNETELALSFTASNSDISVMYSEVAPNMNLNIVPASSEGIDSLRATYSLPDTMMQDTASIKYLLVPLAECPDSCIITIVVENKPTPPIIPGLLTPNGDDKNDTWSFENVNTEEARNFRVRVFNRSGGQVFAAESYDNNWNGGVLPDGVYYYHVEKKDEPDMKPMRGTLLIQRNPIN